MIVSHEFKTNGKSSFSEIPVDFQKQPAQRPETVTEMTLEAVATVID